METVLFQPPASGNSSSCSVFCFGGSPGCGKRVRICHEYCTFLGIQRRITRHKPVETDRLIPETIGQKLKTENAKQHTKTVVENENLINSIGTSATHDPLVSKGMVVGNRLDILVNLT